MTGFYELQEYRNHEGSLGGGTLFIRLWQFLIVANCQLLRKFASQKKKLFKITLKIDSFCFLKS